eukprot:CCRYP_004830-RA/>CCRYP_004830-RA protein AED:0.09 eAED:0.09 QI:0/0/0/1/1/1/3/0/993
MPTFKHNPFGVGQLCNNGCRVLFDTDKVTIFKQANNSILLQGWREPTGAKLWCFSLLPQDHLTPHTSALPKPTALHTGDLPSVGALLHYLHTSAGFPVKSTGLAAIKTGNYASWPGLTYANASKYCPDSTETLKGHLTQTRQGLRSTKPKPAKPITPAVFAPAPAAHKVHMSVEPICKLYTDDIGRFPTRSQSGNQYIMLAYHCDTNVILVEPFQSHHDHHRIAAHGCIMARLQAKGHKIEHQILGNEASADYHTAITQTWNATYQLIPPNVHHANAAERAIQTIKAHFLSILAGIDPSFPNYLWDKLLPQTELTLNLLCQSTLAPTISAWEAYHGPLNYDATPLGPMGCPVIIHNKVMTCKSWDFCGREGFSIGPALLHYRCFQVVDTSTKNLVISDTVEFRNSYLHQPTVTYEDCLLHAINFLSTAISDAPANAIVTQLAAVDALCNLFAQWRTSPSSQPSTSVPLQRAPPPPTTNIPAPTPAPTPRPPPRVAIPPPPKPPPPIATPPAPMPSPRVPAPINHRTRSHHIPTSPGLGLSLEYKYKQLRNHPKLGNIWIKSYANQLGRLCQGIGASPTGTQKRIKGTDTFYVIDYKDITIDCRKEITYTKVVFKTTQNSFASVSTTSPKNSSTNMTSHTTSATAGSISRLSKACTVYHNPASSPTNFLKNASMKPATTSSTTHPAYGDTSGDPSCSRNDFGVKYIGEQHAHHLRDVIKKHYELTENWKGKLYAGINLEWNYANCTCQLTMDEYIPTILFKYNHPIPKKRQLSASKAAPVIYGATTQLTPDEDTSDLLDDKGIKRVQGIVGALLYYARAVDNKLLYTLSDIGTEQAAATECTNTKINQLLDYCATYPNDGITYRASDMILGAHSGAAYLNVNKSRSRAGAHIMCTKNDPIPSPNGPILAIAQIIKFVMSSATEAKLTGLFICAKEMIPLRQSLIEMGWPQPKSPIQTDNTTTHGVSNKTIITKKMKSMDMHLWWLRCRESQGHF